MNLNKIYRADLEICCSDHQFALYYSWNRILRFWEKSDNQEPIFKMISEMVRTYQVKRLVSSTTNTTRFIWLVFRGCTGVYFLISWFLKCRSHDYPKIKISRFQISRFKIGDTQKIDHWFFTRIPLIMAGLGAIKTL